MILTQLERLLTWLVPTALFVAFLGWLGANGFFSADVMRATGFGILDAEGHSTFAEFVTRYPTLPSVATMTATWAAPWSPLPQPLLVSAGLGGLIIVGLAWGYRKAGYDRWVTLALVALVALNPVFLRLMSEGEAFWPVAGGTLFAAGMLRLRHGVVVTNAIIIAIAMFLLIPSHKVGITLVISALPFLVLACPPSILSISAVGAYMALLFPSLFLVLSLVYVSQVFQGDALAFVADVMRDWNLSPIVVPTAGEHMDPTGGVLAGLLSVALVAPIMPAMLVMGWQNVALRMANIALLATACVSVTLCLIAFPQMEPVTALGPILGFAAAAVSWIPRWRRRQAIAIALALLGLIGSAISLGLDGRSESTRWIRAALGEPAGPSPLDPMVDLGARLAGHDGIMLDPEVMPEAIAARRTSKGLILPTDGEFRRTFMTRILTAPAIVVLDPDRWLRPDRIGRNFPDFYGRGADGYQLAYDGGYYRIYQRTGTPGRSEVP